MVLAIAFCGIGKLPPVSDFDSRLSALIDSARLTCDGADEASWNGYGWTPAIILGHLADVDQEVWLARFVIMIDAMHKTQSVPHLEWWEPDAKQTEEKYSAFSLAQAQKNLLASREEVVSFLRALPLADRSALAHHSTFGEITIESMLQVILEHDEEHRTSLGSMNV